MEYIVIFLVGVLVGGFGGYTYGARVKAAAEKVAADVKSV